MIEAKINYEVDENIIRPEFTVMEGRKNVERITNSMEGRCTWVDPIRNKNDIRKILDYIDARIKEAERKDYEWQWERNKLYFILAIYTGFRVSDMIGARPGTKYKHKDKDGKVFYTYPQWTGLKWNDLYDKDGKTIKRKVIVKEIKTGNMRAVPLHGESINAIEHYVKKYQPDTKSGDYVFLNRQKKRLNAATVDDFIKEVTAACNVNGNYSTHSLRKTCIYHRYMGLVTKNDEKMAISKCMQFTGHRSVQAFFKYLGLNYQYLDEMIETFDEYMEDVFKGR